MQIYLYCCGRLAGDIEKYRSWGRLTTFIRLIAKYIVCFSSYHQIISCDKSADVRKTGSGNSSGDFNNKESCGLHSNFISAQKLWCSLYHPISSMSYTLYNPVPSQLYRRAIEIWYNIRHLLFSKHQSSYQWPFLNKNRRDGVERHAEFGKLQDCILHCIEDVFVPPTKPHIRLFILKFSTASYPVVHFTNMD